MFVENPPSIAERNVVRVQHLLAARGQQFGSISPTSRDSLAGAAQQEVMPVVRFRDLLMSDTASDVGRQRDIHQSAVSSDEAAL